MLQDKIAIVTGASRGIGAAIAVELASQGATVVVNHRDSAAQAETVVAQIVAAGGRALAIQADVSLFADAQRLVKETVERFGRVDILVNNAGTTRDTLLMMMSEDAWDVVIQTNLKSAFNCSKAALRPMIKQRGGRIINISSVVGLAGQAGQTNYSASKAGMIGFTKALAREEAGGDCHDAAGPLRQARGDCLRRRVHGQRARRLHHRSDPECGRRAGDAVIY
jgi:3-oxoacyl-[acyl-carrier protein] reductase